MTAEDQTRPVGHAAQATSAPHRPLHARARRIAIRVLGPYARQRARNAQLAASVARLEADLDHLRERHTEQIERLEDLVRELVLAAEALRRRAGQGEQG